MLDIMGSQEAIGINAIISDIAIISQLSRCYNTQ